MWKWEPSAAAVSRFQLRPRLDRGLSPLRWQHQKLGAVWWHDLGDSDLAALERTTKESQHRK